MVDSLIVLTPDLRIETVNEATLKLLGYTESELTGRPMAAIMGHPRRAVPGLVSMSDLLFDEKAGPIELSYHAKNGDRIPVTFSSSILKKPGGTSGIVCVAQNDSRRKAAEIEVREARLAAETASRVKSEFLAMVNHELRTPLHGILGSTELLLESQLAPEPREHAETVQACAAALLKLVGDMLDFGRLDGAETPVAATRFTVAECAQESVEHVAGLAKGKGLDLRVDVAPTVPRTVLGDPIRLRQILMHLLANAVKFTEAGEVVLELRGGKTSPPPRDNGCGLELRFAVRDTGVGIPLDRQGLVFEPFHRTVLPGPQRPGGVGLGLSIAKRLVDMMGGRIWLHSREGEGTTFYFTCPVTAAPAGVPDELLLSRMNLMDAAERRSRVPLGSVVLGGDGFCQAAARWLKTWGHRVDAAGSEDDVLRLWEAGACDLLVVDVQASGLAPLELVQRLRAQERRARRHTAIVGVGDEDRRLERQCLLAGMDAYVGGAPESEALMRAVEAAAEARF
jgi:PAS domain S-box-containing protein